MLAFSGCVLAGASFTAVLRHCAPSPVLHLIWLSAATTSILVGALELAPHGLTVYVVCGMALVWMVLFIGDLVSESDEEGEEASADEASSSGAPRTSLWRSRHHQFLEVAKPKTAASKWRTNAAALRFLARGADGMPREVTAADMLRERLATSASPMAGQ